MKQARRIAKSHNSSTPVGSTFYYAAVFIPPPAVVCFCDFSTRKRKVGRFTVADSSLKTRGFDPLTGARGSSPEADSAGDNWREVLAERDAALTPFSTPTGTSGGPFKSDRGQPWNLVNLGETTDDPSLSRYGLELRADTSQHDDLPYHLNQDIVDTCGVRRTGEFDHAIPSGKLEWFEKSPRWREHISRIRETSTDGYVGLGPVHCRDLFDGDDLV